MDTELKEYLQLQESLDRMYAVFNEKIQALDQNKDKMEATCKTA